MEAWAEAKEAFSSKAYKKAEQLYSEIIRKTKDVNAYYNRAICNYYLKQYQKAMDDLKAIEGKYSKQKLVNMRDRIREAIKQGRSQKTEMDEDGMIKNLSFFKSDIKFKDIVGCEKAKEYFLNNIILAIKRPDLFQKHKKKLGDATILYGPSGTGKCVSGKTKVLLSDGRYIPIEQIVEEKAPEVISLSNQHKIVIKPISAFCKLDGKELLKITTERGREIEVTPEHPFILTKPIIRKSGTGINVNNGKWSPASIAQINDFIGVPRRLPIFGNLPLPEHEVKLLAYFITEGCMTHGQASFTNTDRLILEDFTSSIKQLSSNLIIRDRSKKSIPNVTTYDIIEYANHKGNRGERTVIQKFLDNYKLSYKNSYTKKIPLELFIMPKHLISLFLNRMFSCDGYYTKRNVEAKRYGQKYSTRTIGYSSMSGELAKDIQHLLLRFGIVSSLYQKRNGLFEVTIRKNYDIDLFIEEIGFFGSKHANIQKRPCPHNPKIKAKGGNALTYEKIKKIERLEAPEFVYDLSVNDTHNFVANNFFVHNTFLAKAIAGESGANMIIARINQIINLYVGNSEKNLHKVFEFAREHLPCIIFFDEIDGMATTRSTGQEGADGQVMRRLINEFLQEMDGIEKNPEGLFVIGSTNKPWDIDPAFKRSGRFSSLVYIPPPTFKDREELFKYYLKDKPVGKVNFTQLAMLTADYSQSDISHLCDMSLMPQILEEYNKGIERKMNLKDINETIKKTMPKGSLHQWFLDCQAEIVGKEIISVVDGHEQKNWKPGNMSNEERRLYEPLLKDMERYTSPGHVRFSSIQKMIANILS